MNLELNTNGAWRCVARFEPTPANLHAAKEAAASFGRAIGAFSDDDRKQVSWRLSNGRAALAWCDGPSYVWRKV